jgi:hypothetical protein
MANDKLDVREGSATLAPSTGEGTAHQHNDMTLTKRIRFSRRQLILSFVLFCLFAWAIALLTILN